MSEPDNDRGGAAPTAVTGEFETGDANVPNDAIQRYRRGADRAMVQFVGLRLGLVVISAALPALINYDSTLSSYVAVVVAALAGLDAQFRWGDEWQHYRSTQLAFERLKRACEHREAKLGRHGVGDRDKAHAENFEWLFTEVEALLQSEAERFWRFRITKWQSGGKTS